MSTFFDSLKNILGSAAKSVAPEMLGGSGGDETNIETTQTGTEDTIVDTSASEDALSQQDVEDVETAIATPKEKEVSKEKKSVSELLKTREGIASYISAMDNATGTSAEIYPSINVPAYQGEAGGMPIYTATLLYPYAMLDKRANALLKAQKLAELTKDRIDLKVPKIFYEYQEPLQKSYWNAIEPIIAKEKAKGGAWFDRLKDPNGELMTTVAHFNSFADGVNDIVKIMQDTEKSLYAGKDSENIYLSERAREKMTNVLNATNEFFTNQGTTLPIEELNKLIRDDYIPSVNVQKYLDDEKKLKSADITSDVDKITEALKNQNSKEYTELKKVGAAQFAATYSLKYLDPERSKSKAESLINMHPRDFSKYFNITQKDIEDNSKKYQNAVNELATDLQNVYGQQLTNKLQPIKDVWNEQAAQHYYEQKQEKKETRIPKQAGQQIEGEVNPVDLWQIPLDKQPKMTLPYGKNIRNPKTGKNEEVGGQNVAVKGFYQTTDNRQFAIVQRVIKIPRDISGNIMEDVNPETGKTNDGTTPYYYTQEIDASQPTMSVPSSMVQSGTKASNIILEDAPTISNTYGQKNAVTSAAEKTTRKPLIPMK